MKRLEIEWRHLEKDGKTCCRCSETGKAVQIVHEKLAKELEPKGWKIVFKETILTEQEISESNSLYINGIAIENLLPNTTKSENCCDSCSDILGSPTKCRTLERNGQVFEAIPADMISEAVHKLIKSDEK
ncbi:MAG: DUF2703 domain-containing protein [Thermodesulforhabdaceae bacterium]